VMCAMALKRVVVGCAMCATIVNGAGSGRYTLRQKPGGADGWTLVTPGGEPTFVVALNHLASPFYYEVIQGANGLTPCRPYDTACLDADLFATAYASNWTRATADFVAKAKSWGFNAAGYEFVPSSNPADAMPYLPDLFVTNASHIFASSKYGGGAAFPDVFDVAFNASTDRRVAEWVASDQHIALPRVRRDVIGYYFEDQPLWNVTLARRPSRPTNRSGPTDWVAAMRSLPAAAPGKVTYVDWLQGRYRPTLAGLARARIVYNVPAAAAPTWKALREWQFTTVDGLDPAVVEDDTAFLGVVADRLFGVAAGAVRKYDPKGLIFGQRFVSHDAPPPVLAAAGVHFDVISVQPSDFSPGDPLSAAASADQLVEISRLAGNRPVFVADEGTHFLETAGAVSVTYPRINETEAGRIYADFLADLTARPAIIGYARCQYINRGVTYAGGSLPTLKQGLLKHDGTPHEALVAAITKANHAATAP